MKRVSATEAKQNLGELLNVVAREDVAICRHGKPVAVLTRPDKLGASPDSMERRMARMHQAEIEKDRLIKHQRIAMRMLDSPGEARRLLAEARQTVARWEAENLCSRHFISGWRQLLRLPPRKLAIEMCSDLNGWGNALRQNSPWAHA